MTENRLSTQYQLGQLILSHRNKWTLEDFERLPREVSAELHDGNLILTPPNAASEHMHASRELAHHFDQFVQERPRVLMEVDVLCGRDGKCVRKPDLLVLIKPQRGRPIPAENLLLVGEVVSPYSNDEWGDKMTDYAEAGIGWYLIVKETPAGFRGELHQLNTTGKYDLVADADPAERFHLPAPFGFTIDLRELSY